MKSIKTYITESVNVDKKKFDEDIHTLYKLVDGYGDITNNIRDSIIYGLCDLDDIDEEAVHYKYSERGLYNVLYDIVNFDMISLAGRKINVKNSNHQDIAKIMKKYCPTNIVNRVHDNIYI